MEPKYSTRMKGGWVVYFNVKHLMDPISTLCATHIVYTVFVIYYPKVNKNVLNCLCCLITKLLLNRVTLTQPRQNRFLLPDCHTHVYIIDWLPYICLLLSSFSNYVYHFECAWPTAIKIVCITNFHMMGFSSLVDEIQFKLISSRHICIFTVAGSVANYRWWSH